VADGGLSCPLCLVANDPADMLGVVIAHAVPVPEALIGLCKRCVVAIVKTAMATELISPAEVFGDLPPGAEPPLKTDSEDPSNARLDGLGGPGDLVESDSAAAPAEAGGPLVLPDSEPTKEAKTPSRKVRRRAD
jgi:hypothetical protein